MGEPIPPTHHVPYVPPEPGDEFGAWDSIGDRPIPGEYEPHTQPDTPPAERSRTENVPSDKRP